MPTLSRSRALELGIPRVSVQTVEVPRSKRLDNGVILVWQSI
jgi:hypothetical protein